jgi:GT2 family glycosyltransferase
MPEVSIITALHNCAELTRAYIDSLIKHTSEIDWELILVDDASTDKTQDLLSSYASNPKIRILRNENNMGYSASNNKGSQIAQAPILAFLNNDLLLTPHWLEPMIWALKNSKKPGIIGNVQFNPSTNLIDHAGVFFGLDGMPRQARKNRKKPPKSQLTEWYAVTAACMLISREVFMTEGGFDESYRNGFEDIDLCVKLKHRGYHHYVCNNSQIFHCVSSSPGRHKNNDRNSLTFEKRWTEDTKKWGELDWAPEYLHRYARQWWKFNLGKFLKALSILRKDRKTKHLNYRY